MAGVAKRRKVGNLMALAVLSALVQQPMHPYQMASVLREHGKDQNMKIKWGSLYTVVQNLEKHGLIEATESVRQGGRPERTVYGITDAGRAELTDWVRELLSTPEQEQSRFTAALSVLAVLSPAEAADLLAQRLDALDKRFAGRQAALAEAARDVPRLFLVEEEYELAVAEAEIGFVRGLLGELTSGTFPGLADWQTFSETGVVPPELAELMERGLHPQ
ncbi:PadR family transcriptional regulator [Catellatospora methionotrophica]|uniref:PadR family transcriptional regulator n=1 Tax=Catellatospora methionotrophica TaxID=121620 RepID=A0A8J3L6C8_9ACTN|nr:PadR family transcriptional regulator [Catellatospora methionotrophica]